MARLPAPVLHRTVRTFLSALRIAHLATIGKDGYPHIVPIYFMRDGDELVFGSDNGEQKVRNALRNPKGAVAIGGDPAMDGAGYMIQGDLKVEENPDQLILRKILRRYQTKREAEKLLAEWADSERVLIRLTPRKVIRVW